MEATVFAAYEIEIGLSILQEVTESYSIGTSDDIVIDNTNNSKQYPYLEITADNTVVLSEVSCEGKSVTGSITIGSSDTLILDFDKQNYALNGNNVIEDLTFQNDDRPYLGEDTTSTITFSIDNPINVDIKYNSYNTNIQRDFIRDFRISVDKNYLEDRKFKKDNINELIQETTNFNVSFSNLAYNWEMYDAIDNGKPIRITYDEQHTNGDKSFIRHLLGVKFDTYERFYRDSTGLEFESLTGQGTKLI